MRGNVYEYEMARPASLDEALATLGAAEYQPLAGGTELMVALGAGKLPRKPILSINQLKELRFIDVTANAVTIGSGTTFSDLRSHPVIAGEFALLSQASSWIGSIANQNRATIGGNIVNASPAADAPPALLVYDALVTLVSRGSERTLAYREFHLGYKQTAMRPNELLHSIQLSRSHGGYISYIRKVGARNAQAISKVAMAGVVRLRDGAIDDIRIAAASLREVPWRFMSVEKELSGRRVDEAAIADARYAFLRECQPIDDIRSTAAYRSAVGANLLEELLRSMPR